MLQLKKIKYKITAIIVFIGVFTCIGLGFYNYLRAVSISNLLNLYSFERIIQDFYRNHRHFPDYSELTVFVENDYELHDLMSNNRFKIQYENDSIFFTDISKKDCLEKRHSRLNLWNINIGFCDWVYKKQPIPGLIDIYEKFVAYGNEGQVVIDDNLRSDLKKSINHDWIGFVQTNFSDDFMVSWFPMEQESTRSLLVVNFREEQAFLIIDNKKYIVDYEIKKVQGVSEVYFPVLFPIELLEAKGSSLIELEF